MRTQSTCMEASVISFLNIPSTYIRRIIGLAKIQYENYTIALERSGFICFKIRADMVKEWFTS